MRQLLRDWVPALAWMGLILFMSGDTGSAEHSGAWLTAFLGALGLGGAASPETLAALNAVVRKMGHFLAYATLALLYGRLARRVRGRPDAAAMVAAWTAAVAWATLDEWHQSFFASRGASPADVALDALGAAAGLLVYHQWLNRQTEQAA
jgi:VanZ family protein